MALTVRLAVDCRRGMRPKIHLELAEHENYLLRAPGMQKASVPNGDIASLHLVIRQSRDVRMPLPSLIRIARSAQVSRILQDDASDSQRLELPRACAQNPKDV